MDLAGPETRQGFKTFLGSIRWRRISVGKIYRPQKET